LTGERTLRYGVHVPNLWEYGDPRVIADLAELAEKAGWDGFFIWDHILYSVADGPDVCDPWVALSAAAVRTSRVRLGALMTAVARRRPWKLAREVASLDQLSGGRIVFGAGLGVPADAEFSVYGEDPDPLVRREKLDEGLDILRLLWAGAPASYTGKHFQLGPVVFRPTPIQADIPIWVGGNWPSKRPFQRAARLDGVMPERGGGELLSPPEVAAAVAYVRQERVRQGIDPSRPLDVATAGYTDLSDGEHARDTVASYAAAGATWWIERFHPGRGSLEQTKARVAEGPPRI
jgi:alkanesulfonate monooxygenase SsuD/methylene tetrahydromethanopterin reductase-like flavin-dependent oxidoreductase (luciferase family)